MFWYLNYVGIDNYFFISVRYLYNRFIIEDNTISFVYENLNVFSYDVLKAKNLKT